VIRQKVTNIYSLTITCVAYSSGYSPSLILQTLLSIFSAQMIGCLKERFECAKKIEAKNRLMTKRR
jgi:hypothetical protein